MTVWSAVVKNIEYFKPIYKTTIDVKKGGVVVGAETVDINDSILISEAAERIKDVLRRYQAAESIGADLNKYIGKEIVL